MSETGLFARIFGRGSDDAGRGRLEDYDYNLRPKRNDVVIRLAESDPNQDELQRTIDSGAEEIWAMIPRRGIEEERADAPMPVRLFVTGRVSQVVGMVPRGLEAPVEDALARLSESGKPPRIPVGIVSTKGGLRVDVKIGRTR